MEELKIKKYINKNENFMVTYGDGLSNVNIKIINYHKVIEIIQ